MTSSPRSATDTAAELRRITLEVYRRGADLAAGRGVIIADTKLEFGRAPDGTLVLADEVLTSDSSRFWAAEEWKPGGPQRYLDKQFVRDWSSTITSWDRTPPGPPRSRRISWKPRGPGTSSCTSGSRRRAGGGLTMQVYDPNKLIAEVQELLASYGLAAEITDSDTAQVGAGSLLRGLGIMPAIPAEDNYVRSVSRNLLAGD